MASFIISKTGVRSKKPEYIGFSKSYDKSLDIEKGDILKMKISKYSFYCESIEDLYSEFI